MNKEERLIKDLKDSAKKDLAFETLVNLYKEKLYFQIRRIVLNHDDTMMFFKMYLSKFTKELISSKEIQNLVHGCTE